MNYAIPYIIFFSLVTLFTLFPSINGKYIRINKDTFYIQELFLFLILFIFIGCRAYVYSDCHSYKMVWDTCPSVFTLGFGSVKLFLSSWKGMFETGFLLFCVLIRSFTSEFLLFQMINFLIDFCLLLNFINYYIENERDKSLFFFILFAGIGMEFNLLRNTKAIFLFLYASRYILDKHFLKYFLIMLVAFTFHTSAIFYIPLYFIINKNWNKKTIILLFIIGNLLTIFQIRWMYILGEKISSSLGIGVAWKIVLYFMKDNSFSIFSLGYIERTFTFILVLKYSKKIKKLRFGNFIVNSYYLYGFSYLFFFESTQFAERFGFLFAYSYWLFYPLFIKNLKKREKAFCFFLLFMYGLAKFYAANDSIDSQYSNFLITGF